ncbi:MAG TPA: transcription antitermination factor NusB [Candidatus Sphingobacterium stercoripullorum]|uniref:Transcription antitermination factor NusB n=1 Tax=Candidatus Sphingobacterium stercoripullorum TaxID=2838759 RepID=A0A9D1WAL6_9SPHI|nr:transcription antitermination factor NusB [Candidatus Sphingobacterium stercoripullorum]
MLNRRNLRVKVLETLYAYSVSDDKEIKKFEKQLLKNVELVDQMYIWTLNLLDEAAGYVTIDAESRANKFIPDERDKIYTTKLDSNTFIESLRRNKTYLERVKRYKVDWSFDPEIVRVIFSKLKDTEEYLDYLKNEDRSIDSEKNIIRYIFRQIILKTPEIDQSFEALFLHWVTDKEVLKAMIAKTFKNFSSENPSENRLVEITPNWEEDRNFVIQLLQQTIRYEHEYQNLISENSKNWDSDRLALMDTLIMRMALVEFEHFFEIPIKVTLNEYIDLAKQYSTHKSGVFVNGILNKILVDFREQGRVNKHGRGLIG